jgi:hypothetical protein
MLSKKMKFNKQGVRDLSTQAVVFVEPDTNITHYQHYTYAATTACMLDTRANKMYRPLEPQAITCLGCLGADKANR